MLPVMCTATWLKTVGILFAAAPPVVVWPAERRRVVRGLSGNVIDPDDLPLRFAPTAPQHRHDESERETPHETRIDSLRPPALDGPTEP
ncbi:hypothetical protein RFUL19S_04368 [Rhizobacter fulvus]